MNNSTHQPALTRIDASTDEGLKRALRKLHTAEDWNGPVGRAVIDQLRLRALAVVRASRASADLTVAHLVDGLISIGWEIATAQRADILAADRPWGLIVRALARAAVQEVRSAELVTSGDGTRWAVAGGWHTARRLGMDGAQVTDRLVPARHDPTGDAVTESRPDDPAVRWDPGLIGLRDELVATGSPRALATELISAALDVLQLTRRRSHVHYTAYRDERLARLLATHQIRALVDLLIGTRRDGPAGSAWLALREAAQAGGPVSLADAHPQSLPRLAVLAQAWTRPTSRAVSGHLNGHTPARPAQPGHRPSAEVGGRVHLRATSGARRQPPMGCRARRTAHASTARRRTA
ncbi:hypothetical protein [Jiangella alkaliphila]|uniref:Uncharacterized protein n=1 Tax=Jiangella alkaliphila TaxID=419479 RepID=A0A1H2GCQ8_9ACTN|nr:hypothetical protein [Jiangella alkaliphila]SDU17526.1 hypothetical protein SAMN04488563_0431 [Jiangella alkaliphila]